MKSTFEVHKVANGYILVGSGGISNSRVEETYIAADIDALQQVFVTHLVKYELNGDTLDIHTQAPVRAVPKKPTVKPTPYTPSVTAATLQQLEEILNEVDNT